MTAGDLFFLKGILIGLLFGIPIGAVGALTIRRIIIYSRRAGFLSGLGCSTADLCYSCISIFGFTLISDYLLHIIGNKVLEEAREMRAAI